MTDLEKKEIEKRFERWIMEIEFEFLQEKLLQPIGIEISSVPIVIEFCDDFCDVENTNASAKDFMPLAYYVPATDDIHITADHPSFEKRSIEDQVSLLAFLLFHEANHRLLMTMPRKTNRDHELWNIATDFEIHNMFYLYNELHKSKNFSAKILRNFMTHTESFLIRKNEKFQEGLFDEAFLNMVAEEIYSYLLNSKKVDEQTITFQKKSSGSQQQKNSSNNGQNSNSENNSENNSDSSESDNESESNSGSGKGKKKESKQNGGGNEESDSENENGEGDEDSKSSSGKQSKNKNNSGSGKPGITVKTVTYKTPSGKEITSRQIVINEGEYQKSAKKQKDSDSSTLNKTLMESTVKDAVDKERSNGRGFGHNKVMEFLKKLFKVKIDWKKILRNSLQTALEKSDYFTWAHPRISMFGLSNAPYLPAQANDYEGYGTLVIVRDESGSIGTDVLQAACGIIKDAKDHYKKIVLIKHDDGISSVNEFEDLSDDVMKRIVMTRESSGGTSHRQCFEWIRDYSKNHQDEDRISCCIFITDMYSDIEESQNLISDKIPRIYMCPADCEKNHNKVKGVIIPIEI